MKLFTTTLCLLTLLSFLFLVKGKDTPLPKFIINLDLPPEERWGEVARKYTYGMKELLGSIMKSMSSTYEMISIMGGDIEEYLPEPYASEVRGISKYTNITTGELVFINMLYEVTAFSANNNPLGGLGCTSILSQTSSGRIIHARNLDYRLSLLRDISFMADFQQSGNTVYTMTTFAGYIGALTGQKPNKFTVSMDERNIGDWHSNVIAAQHVGTKGIISLIMRDLLSDPNADFEYVVNSLSNSELIAPCYLIVGGLNDNEGAVITHNRTKGIDVWRLNSAEGRWFLVETNYDHWTPPPNDDNRRDPAIKMMNATGIGQMSYDSIVKVLSAPPVLNDGTIYTTVMSASDPDAYTGWIRNPNNN